MLGMGRPLALQMMACGDQHAEQAGLLVSRHAPLPSLQPSTRCPLKPQARPGQQQQGRTRTAGQVQRHQLGEHGLQKARWPVRQVGQGAVESRHGALVGGEGGDRRAVQQDGDGGGGEPHLGERHPGGAQGGQAGAAGIVVLPDVLNSGSNPGVHGMVEICGRIQSGG